MQFILIGILLNLVVGAAQAADVIDPASVVGSGSGSLNSVNVVNGGDKLEQGNNNVNQDSATKIGSDNTTHNYHGTVNQEAGTQRKIIDTNQVGPAHLTNLTTSGADTCFGSQTSAVSLPGVGAFGNGKTIVDENCELLKQTKLLASLGLKDAAVCLMYQADEKFAQAMKSAYPQLEDLCDPRAAERKAVAKAEEERVAELQRYLDAGLKAPSHLYVPVNARSEDYKEVDFWINDNGEKCRREYIPFTNVQTTECR